LRLLLCVPLPLTAAAYMLTVDLALPWFEDLVLVDVWMFVLVFACRKGALFTINLHEKDEMVRFFKTTCYDFIESAPRAELLYSATTGLSAVIGTQLGKFFLLEMSRSVGLLPLFRAIYLSGFGAFVIMGDPTHGFNCNVMWFEFFFRRHHRFFHLSAAQYLTKHWEHHDVLPIASIGSQGSGYQEAFVRCIAPWQYPGSAFFGPNTYSYSMTSGDEWSHNYCPTASLSGVIAIKHVHVDHHFNRTVPLGVNYDRDVAEDGFRYDMALWENISSFLPDGFQLPEREPPNGVHAAFGAGAFNIPGGPDFERLATNAANATSLPLALAIKALVATSTAIAFIVSISNVLGALHIIPFAVLSSLLSALLRAKPAAPEAPTLATETTTCEPKKNL